MNRRQQAVMVGAGGCALAAIYWIIIVVLGSGCATTAPVGENGIPNFRWLDKPWGICAGGEPTLKGWYWLSTQNAGQSGQGVGKINHVIKLNSDDEGNSDNVAILQLGMQVDKFPISTSQQLEPSRHAELDALIDQALHTMTPGTFVHCTHGEDRTGAFVYAYRRDHGWTDAQAREELMTNGFHSVLLGLEYFVDRYQPVPAAPYGIVKLRSPKER